jgi:hypothetical protein
MRRSVAAMRVEHHPVKEFWIDEAPAVSKLSLAAMSTSGSLPFVR